MATQREQQPREQGQTSVQRSEPSVPVRRETYGSTPFSSMRRFTEDFDRLFQNFFGSKMMPWSASSDLAQSAWWPDLEIFHRDNKLVIQADLPGLKREDVNVELRGNELCISGERKSESEEREGGYYRSERTYGSFCRTIPLPAGAKPDTASATFDNGVLRIELEAPGGERGKRIEVREGRGH